MRSGLREAGRGIAFRPEAVRPGYDWVGHFGDDCRGLARHLHPSPPSDQGGSYGGAAIRVAPRTCTWMVRHDGVWAEATWQTFTASPNRLPLQLSDFMDCSCPLPETTTPWLGEISPK